MADQHTLLDSGTPAFRFYDHYLMPLSVLALEGAIPSLSAREGDCCLLLVLDGSLSSPSRLEALRAPFFTCMKRGEAFASASSAVSGFAVSFQPEIVNQEVLQALPLPEISDPLLRRDADLVRTFYEDTGLCRELDPSEADFMALLFRQVHLISKSQADPYWPCRSRSYFLEILVLISGAGGEEPESTRAVCAMDYIQANYQHKLTLDSLSRALGTNRTSLQRSFTAAYGTSVFGFIQTYRIRMAQLMIRNTFLSLKEIAARTGFGDYSRFFREFSRQCGLSPQEFREGKSRVRVYRGE